MKSIFPTHFVWCSVVDVWRSDPPRSITVNLENVYDKYDILEEIGTYVPFSIILLIKNIYIYHIYIGIPRD
jgi:hypothetical protein